MLKIENLEDFKVTMTSVEEIQQVAFSLDHAFAECAVNKELSQWMEETEVWQAVTDDRIKVASDTTE